VTLCKKVEIFAILGATFLTRAPIGVKFCTTKRTQMPLSCAKFHANRGENADFWPASEFNTGSLLLRGIMLVTTVVV